MSRVSFGADVDVAMRAIQQNWPVAVHCILQPDFARPGTLVFTVSAAPQDSSGLVTLDGSRITRTLWRERHVRAGSGDWEAHIWRMLTELYDELDTRCGGG